MDKEEQVRRWLERANSSFFWTVDSLGKQSRSGGVFPQGTKTVSRTTDILGNERVRLADSYLIKLRLAASGEQDSVRNAYLVRLLTNYISNPMPGKDQVMKPGKVSLISSDGSTAVYQLTLTIEYWKP